MLEIVPTLNFYVALAGIFGQLVTVGLILAFFLRSRSEIARSIVQFTGERGLLLAFLASLGASILTLFYSETIGLRRVLCAGGSGSFCIHKSSFLAWRSGRRIRMSPNTR